MMGILKRINSLLQENRENQNRILAQMRELEWAQIYHDSIRGKKWLQDLPLNIGRWAGNYAFFYVLNRILNDYKPKSILEFGLGESTKFISAYLDNYLTDTTHLVIEQDESWKRKFEERSGLSKQTQIKICPLEKSEVKGFETNHYKAINQVVNKKFNLYVIDGPQGTVHYSRYDLVIIAQDFSKEDEFVILLDDYDRPGEKETVADLLNIFKESGIIVSMNTYTGNKSVLVIATEKYRYTTTF